MRLALKLHPESECLSVGSIEVDVTRSASTRLMLHYRVRGIIENLRLPPLAAPERMDGLWQHSCFEAFVASPDAAGYLELNFAPSRQWAAYRLSGYRSGMIEAKTAVPLIETHAGEQQYDLTAQLDLEQAPALPWRVGLSAILEETNGRKSYWALAHPPGQPDFHHKDCFALELPPAA